ncbi:MAG: hypothetical protein VKN72_07360 [Nostocales cyanobacterium 94392]|nr:hypothetical protein [Nostocales cyanobacterium 94392]
MTDDDTHSKKEVSKMKTIADVAPQTWWQKLNALVIVFQATMDIDILGDRIKRRIADLEAQLHNSNVCVSGSINSSIESGVSHD